LASTRLVFCDETLPNLTKGKTLGFRERKGGTQRKNQYPTNSEHPSAQKPNGNFSKKTLWLKTLHG
jgi:hypothetical protein